MPDDPALDAESVPPDDAPTSPPIPRPPALFRPTDRPPTARLTVCDDGRTDGEVVRLRGDGFVIGRSEGDLVIPHDALISSRHAAVTREAVPGGYQWVVTDLGSTNGLFVRVRRAKLADGSEFLVGRGRFRFEAADPGPAPDGTTKPWGSASAARFRPAVAEVVNGKVGGRVQLAKSECWIGSDPGCAVCRMDDPFLAHRHARVYRDPRGRWYVQSNKSLNGLWVKTARIVVAGACAFQIGEQRFRLRVG